MIVTENFSFNFVESVAFVELLKVLDPDVENLLIKADALTEHVMATFHAQKEKLANMFEKSTAKVSLTTDAWTSPNSKSIFGVTGHWVDDENNLRELVLDAVEIRGPHSDVNLAEYVMDTLNDFDLKEKLYCITADNASNNVTMARQLTSQLPNFNAEEDLLGCTGHVINLAAQAGLKALGHEFKEGVSFSDGNNNSFDCHGWGNEFDLDDVDDCDPSSIIYRVRETIKYIRNSPQRRLCFENTVKLALPLSLKQAQPIPSSSNQLENYACPTRPASSRIAARLAFYFCYLCESTNIKSCINFV